MGWELSEYKYSISIYSNIVNELSKEYKVLF